MLYILISIIIIIIIALQHICFLLMYNKKQKIFSEKQ